MINISNYTIEHLPLIAIDYKGKIIKEFSNFAEAVELENPREIKTSITKDVPIHNIRWVRTFDPNKNYKFEPVLTAYIKIYKDGKIEQSSLEEIKTITKTTNKGSGKTAKKGIYENNILYISFDSLLPEDKDEVIRTLNLIPHALQ